MIVQAAIIFESSFHPASRHTTWTSLVRLLPLAGRKLTHRNSLTFDETKARSWHCVLCVFCRYLRQPRRTSLNQDGRGQEDARQHHGRCKWLATHDWVLAWRSQVLNIVPRGRRMLRPLSTVFSRTSCLGRGVNFRVGVCWLRPGRRMPLILAEKFHPPTSPTHTHSLASGHSDLLKYKTIQCRNNTAPFIFSPVNRKN